MIKIGKTLGTAALAVALAGCGGMVSFRNASFWKGDATETISGVLAKPEGKGPFPAVVLLHHCGGLTDNVLVDWPNYLTALGYVTLSVDSFGPWRLVRCPVVLTLHQKSKDAYGELKYLASLPFVAKERIGVMEFSMGGTTIDGFIRQE